LIAAFGKKPPKKTKDRKIEYKVTSVRKLKDDFRVANVDICFDGELKVTFGLLRKMDTVSRAKIPVVNFEVSYPDNFKIKSKKLRKEIDHLVISQGLKAYGRKE
jgi:hypothetical protein